MRLARVGAIVAACACLIAVPARASFPGVNGKIAIERAGGQIHLINSDGSGETPLTTGSGPAWAPNGARLAFTRSDGLYVSDADGTGVTRITAGVRFGQPAWSPNGGHLVYLQGGFCDEFGCDPNKFFRVNSDGTGNTELGPFASAWGPSWRPDGSRIAFTNLSELWTMKPDGTDAGPITAFGRESVGPEWAPDATKIVFDSFSYDTPAQRGLATVNSNGVGSSGFTIINNSIVRAGTLPPPSWSPDGKQLALVNRHGVCDPSCHWDLFVLDADGSDLTQVTSLDDLRDADWQPIPIFGYPRPLSAHPLQVSLVPSYQQCTSPNRAHGPPLAHPSCAPPAQTSSQLTVGTFDANGQPPQSTAKIFISTLVGDPTTPADEADIRLRATVTDVRLASELSDYTGALQARMTARITDRDNAPYPGGPGAATVEDITYAFPIPCASTGDTTIGSRCEADTTADALVAGTAKERHRAIWELGQAEIYDGVGVVFMRQGVFVP